MKCEWLSFVAVQEHLLPKWKKQYNDHMSLAEIDHQKQKKWKVSYTHLYPQQITQLQAAMFLN